MIYFIQNGDHDLVKIGYTSKTVQARIESMQTGNPVELKLIESIAGNQDSEKALHRKFKAQRRVGEWFQYSGPVKEYVLSGDAIRDQYSTEKYDFEHLPEWPKPKSIPVEKETFVDVVRHLEKKYGRFISMKSNIFNWIDSKAGVQKHIGRHLEAIGGYR